MRRLIALLCVLFLLAIGVDRLAAGYAAAEAEEQLVTQGFRSPEVTIRGFPFLTQLRDGTYERVEGRASSWQEGTGRAVDISATLLGVRADLRQRPSNIRIERLTATATIPYGEVLEVVTTVPGLKLAQGSNGEARVSAIIEILGQTFDVQARGRIEARGTRIRVVPTGIEVEGAGALDDQLSELIADRIAFDYPVPGLPPGVNLRSVTAGPSGFVVRVSGRNTTLRRR